MKKNIVLSVLLACVLGMTVACNTDNSSDKEEIAVTTAQQAQRSTLTKSQAADEAQKAVEWNFERGFVFVWGEVTKAASYGLVRYGDYTYDYDSETDTHTFNIKGTCWGYDSYGVAIAKYTFDAEVHVEGDSASCSNLTLEKL